MVTQVKRILVIRNDKLGDFMLAWPAFALLKKQYPEASVVALVPHYTSPMAELCPSIDEIIIDDIKPAKLRDIADLSKKIRNANIDASISLFSESRTALALWLAGVGRRFGPATKIAQVFLNNRLRQKRSLSAKPEFEYNIDLVNHFIHCNNSKPVAVPTPPYLTFDQSEINAQKHDYYLRNNIDSERKLVYIHPGSGGSAINLSLQQFAVLANALADSCNIHIVITAGPGELKIAESLAVLVSGLRHTIYHSTQGLVPFSRFIAMCDLFISGSTGPLHIAGALNVPTAAFYPARKSATPLRWQTLNEASRRVASSPEKYSGENDMQTIDIASCARGISGLLEE